MGWKLRLAPGGLSSGSRKASCFGARRKEGPPPAGANPLRLGFVAQMVDNGYVFEGPHWRLTDSPLQGLYFRPLVYRDVRGLDAFQPWLDRILHFPEEIVDQAVKQLPAGWLEGEEEALEKLLAQLMMRRKRVPQLIDECRQGRGNPFPNRS